MLFQLAKHPFQGRLQWARAVHLPGCTVLCMRDLPCKMPQETPLAPLGIEFIHFILETWPSWLGASTSPGLHGLLLAPSPFTTLWTDTPLCGRGFRQGAFLPTTPGYFVYNGANESPQKSLQGVS